MPWDLIFYGAMAITFIGIIMASRKARRERAAAAAGTPGNGAAGQRDRPVRDDHGAADGGAGDPQ